MDKRETQQLQVKKRLREMQSERKKSEELFPLCRETNTPISKETRKKPIIKDQSKVESVIVYIVLF